jgi:hypothetical protein
MPMLDEQEKTLEDTSSPTKPTLKNVSSMDDDYPPRALSSRLSIRAHGLIPFSSGSMSDMMSPARIVRYC